MAEWWLEVQNDSRFAEAAQIDSGVGRWAAQRLRMVGHRGVAGVEPLRRRVEQVESLRPTTRATTSAVTPPHGKASPTASIRPVRATEASTVSMSSGLTDAQVDHLDLPAALVVQALGGAHGLVDHRAVGDHRGVLAGPGDPRLADRQALALDVVGAFSQR